MFSVGVKGKSTDAARVTKAARIAAYARRTATANSRRLEKIRNSSVDPLLASTAFSLDIFTSGEGGSTHGVQGDLAYPGVLESGESLGKVPKQRVSQRLKRFRLKESDDDGINENGPPLGDNSLRTEGGEADTDIFHSPVLKKYKSAAHALLDQKEGSPEVMAITKAWWVSQSEQNSLEQEEQEEEIAVVAGTIADASPVHQNTLAYASPMHQNIQDSSQNEEDSLEQEGEIAVAAGTIAYASPMHQTTQDSSEDEGFPLFSESKGIQNTPRMKNRGTQTEVDEEEEEEEEEEEKEEEKIYTQNMATQTEEGLGGEQDKSNPYPFPVPY